MSERVAVLGLGTMGMGMAKNLLKAGFPITVYNRNRAKADPLEADGAVVAASPREAAKDADVILSMVADDGASRAMWTGTDGALAGAKEGAVLVESSTVTPEWIMELEKLAAERKVSLVDAPVTGSKPQAEGAQLIFFAGGEAEVIERIRPVLQAMSKDVVLLGPTGSGARMKLINNYLAGVQVASLAEAMVWMERSGLDREQALTLLKKGAPGSPIMSTISERMVTGTYEVNFLLSLMGKDLHYAHRDAASLGVPLRMAKMAETLFSQAAEEGFAEKDMSAVIEPLRAAAKTS